MILFVYIHKKYDENIEIIVKLRDKRMFNFHNKKAVTRHRPTALYPKLIKIGL